MRTVRTTRRGALLALLLGLVLLAAACADDDADGAADDDSGDVADEADESDDDTDDDTGDDTGDDEADDGAGEMSLGEACDGHVVLQTDWMPQTGHAAEYQLAGPGGDFDPGEGVYTNEVDGATVEVRAGGPFIGFQGMASTMYQDDDILLGMIVTDESVRFSERLPTVAVVAPRLRSPQILMWDPEAWDFDEFADIGESDAQVLYFEGASYMEYLIGQGYIRAEQADSSYDGTPARFIAEGDLVQQGFVTSEPHNYEHEYEDWGRPVDYLLIDEAGFNIYPQTMAARPDVIEDRAECLEVVVPMLQQSMIDYLEDPEPLNETIMEIANAVDYATTEGLIEHSLEAMEEYDLVGNGHNDTFGDQDMERVQSVVDALNPIFEEQGEDAWDPEVTAEDIATNEFIDPDITLD